jgi:hypothetical protein
MMCAIVAFFGSPWSDLLDACATGIQEDTIIEPESIKGTPPLPLRTRAERKISADLSCSVYVTCVLLIDSVQTVCH